MKAFNDTDRVDWLLRNVSGREFRELGITYVGNMSRVELDREMRRRLRRKRSNQGKCDICGRFLLADGSCPKMWKFGENCQEHA